MKKTFFLFSLLSLLATLELSAQTPDAFQYQAVVRNTQGDIVKNQSVNIRFSIHKTTATGTVVFTETQTATTTNNGIISLQIGTGTPGFGSFGLGEIDWTAGIYFMQVEVDNGSGYNTLTTQQLLSIPYAKYAQAAGSVRIKSPDGSIWNVTINNEGNISTTKIQ